MQGFKRIVFNVSLSGACRLIFVDEPCATLTMQYNAVATRKTIESGTNPIAFHICIFISTFNTAL